MRIALVHRLFTRAGGVEKNVVLLAEGLAARGHEVVVYCARADQPAPEGVTLRMVRMRGFGIAAKYASFANAAARALSEDPAFDVVQGFDLTVKQDVLRVGRGLVKVYRDVLDGTRNPIDRWWRRVSPGARALLALEERMLAPGAWTRIVAISRSVRRELIEAYAIPEHAIEIVYNGVDLQALTPEKAQQERAAMRTELGLPAGDPVVLFVGTGFRRKGLDVLLQAHAMLVKKRPDARLLVVGRDGRARAYRARARALGIGNRVTFAGSRKADAALYGAADVVALPTLYEPFGNVVLEALACGVPAVVTAAAGASDVLEEELSDLVLPSAGDATRLAEILDSTLGAPRAPLTALCRRVAERYSEEACVSRYEAIYKRLVARRAA